jgi:hypothetical protein
LRKLIILLAAMAMALGTTATAAAADESIELDTLLVDTTVFGIPADQVPLGPPAVNDPGTSWVSSGIWHVRGLPVVDTIVDVESGEVIGSLTRSVNFNLDLESFTSHGWCSFTADFYGIGTISGYCFGSLLSGTIVGNGDAGHYEGTYELTPGGVFGVGPYSMTGTIS